MRVFQSNARSLIANGQEFKHFIEELYIKPNVICVQETWLKCRLEYVLQGYNVVHHERKEGNGGGYATFIKQGIQHRVLGKGRDQEYISVGVWGEDRK